MKQCPHAKSTYYCGVLLNSGFTKEAVYVPENWWDKYCVSGKYNACPNLNSARSMKQDERRRKGTYLGEKDKSTNAKAQLTKDGNKPAIRKNKSDKKINPFHATGGIDPHYCEKPWRSGSLRFRIIKSLLYLKPWK